MMQKRCDKFADRRSTFGSVAWYVYCVFVLFVALTNGLPSGFEPKINIKWGPIRGKWSTSLNGRPIANFLGIPYALPPLGDLRFKNPQRWNRTWTTIRDGTVDGQICTQLSHTDQVIGGEDCLYLNVFVPMILDKQPAGWPVIVYVHGGSFYTGSSDSKLYAPDYLMDHDVILVTLNYRLNVLGFFSTTNQVAPGNYGLKDIMAALHWVQENIHSFGGNPGSVTIIGSSAGAALIHMLALSDKSEGLFHRYILHSGSALHTWSIHSRQKYRLFCLELARMVGCLPMGTDNTTASKKTIFVTNFEESGQCSGMYDTSSHNIEQDEKMMKCMRAVDTSEMLRISRNFSVWGTHSAIIFSPILEEKSEDAVMTMHPLKVMRKGLFRNMPAIIEVTKDEGLLKSINFIMSDNVKNKMIENFVQYLPYLTEYQGMIFNTSVFADAIRDFYFNGNLTESSLMYNITAMLSDALITWPSFRTVQYLSEVGNASVYLSLFAYQGTFSWTFESGSSTLYGVCHADDINYLFPTLNNKFADRMLHNTENDYTMINIMTEMWTNFAKDGIPRAWTIPVWPDYRDHHQFMRIGNDSSPDIAVQADFLSARMEFWEKLIANVSTICDMGSDMFTDDSPDNIITAIANMADHRLTLSNVVLIATALVGAFI